MWRPATATSQKMRPSPPAPWSKPALWASIRRMVADLGFPLNILAGPGTPSVPELRKLGVARVSLGSWPMRAAMGVLRGIADELKSTGTYAAMEGAPSHAEM